MSKAVPTAPLIEPALMVRLPVTLVRLTPAPVEVAEETLLKVAAPPLERRAVQGERGAASGVDGRCRPRGEGDGADIHAGAIRGGNIQIGEAHRSCRPARLTAVPAALL